jgi:hypothetical protein
MLDLRQRQPVRNEVIRHVNLQWRPEAAVPTPLQIVEAAEKMLS